MNLRDRIEVNLPVGRAERSGILGHPMGIPHEDGGQLALSPPGGGAGGRVGAGLRPAGACIARLQAVALTLLAVRWLQIRRSRFRAVRKREGRLIHEDVRC